MSGPSESVDRTRHSPQERATAARHLPPYVIRHACHFLLDKREALRSVTNVLVAVNSSAGDGRRLRGGQRNRERRSQGTFGTYSSTSSARDSPNIRTTSMSWSARRRRSRRGTWSPIASRPERPSARR